MSFSNISFETEEGGIARLIIQRPQKLNALNAATLDELEAALNQCENDGGIRGLLITGGGDKAFVAGADINELAEAEPMEAVRRARRGQDLFRRIERSTKPSIAAINGFALGGGLELAMSCTMRVAGSRARLGQPEVKLGIIAGYGGTQRLPRLVGRGRALDLLLTGEPISAEEAHRIGLVNHVVPDDQLLDFSRGLLLKILANGPLAVALTLEAVDVGLSCGLDEGLRFEANAFGLAASTADCKEGTRAFLEKRTPVFAGN